MISVPRFTGLSKDYLLKDLISFENTHGILISHLKTYPVGHKKADVFQRVMAIVEILKKYDSSSSVIKVQSVFRRKRVLLSQEKYRCSNTEDFFTFDPLRDVPSKYYYSYVDDQGHRWGFDIRSLVKLFEMKYANPYTTRDFPIRIRREVIKTYRKLRRSESYEDIVDDVIRTRREDIKQRLVDVFSTIERSGYTCQITWFLSLPVNRLRELYRQLEDLWNYRSELTGARQRCIVPPDGRFCSVPVTHVMTMESIEDLQSLLVDEISKFARAPNEGDQTVGFILFLTGLGCVSPECFASHEWIAYV